MSISMQQRYVTSDWHTRDDDIHFTVPLRILATHLAQYEPLYDQIIRTLNVYHYEASLRISRVWLGTKYVRR